MSLQKGTGTGSLAKELYDAMGIESSIDSSDGIPSDQKATQKSEALTKLQNLADTIIDHLKNNADVTGIATSVSVTSVSGVTTGPGVSGPGTGSGSQTGTGNIQ